MTNNKNIFYHLPSLLKDAFKELSKNDPLRMAGATAFFTTFALPPILIILIQMLGLIFNPRTISHELFKKLTDLLGAESVQQVMDVLLAFRKLAQKPFYTIGGFLFLLFVATTLFKVIKGSLNQVWKIKVVQKRRLLRGLKARITSVAVILIAGLLFVIGLVTEGAQAYVRKYIMGISPLLAVYFNNILNYILSIIIVTVWFAIMFRFLPDAKPRWKVIFAGAFVTSILFNAGKIVLHLLLTYSNINTVYGASAAIVLLMLFVFYCSLILYYGAAFTKVWGAYHDMPIKPNHYAIHYQLAEADEDDVLID